MKILTEIHTTVQPTVHIRIELAHREAETLFKALEGAENPVLRGIKQAALRACEATKG